MELTQFAVPKMNEDELVELEEMATIDPRYAAMAKVHRVVDNSTLPVVDIQEVFQKAGKQANQKPPLAIARADVKYVYYAGWAWEREILKNLHFYGINERPYTTSNFFTGTKFHFPGYFSDVHVAVNYSSNRLLAPLPVIPPKIRKNYILEEFMLLWEPGDWETMPSPDPALLQHLYGDLYAVVETWDMTELERYVLSR